MRFAERVLAGGVATFRAGSVLLLSTALVASGVQRHRSGLLVLVVVGVVQSVEFAVVCWRTGRLRTRWVLADLAGLATVLAVSETTLVGAGGAGVSPLYNFVLIASIEAGVALGGSGIFVMVNVAQAGPG